MKRRSLIRALGPMLIWAAAIALIFYLAMMALILAGPIADGRHILNRGGRSTVHLITATVFVLSAIVLWSTALYRFLRTPARLCLTSAQLRYSRGKREITVNFAELTGVVQRFKIPRYNSLVWLHDYRLHTPEGVVRLDLTYLRDAHLLEQRLRRRNERLTAQAIEALRREARQRAGQTGVLAGHAPHTRDGQRLDDLPIPYRRNRRRQLEFDFARGELRLSSRTRIGLGELARIAVDCTATRANGGGRELVFHLTEGRRQIRKTKNYAFDDPEWNALLLGLQLAALQLGIPLDYIVPANRPLASARMSPSG
ncbi:hypothetical protein IDH44_06415 [Paenibacillus sp. IB182496]|uniref:Uncharacterized protein n=1 Tax=Paenibacillus sabuli TaxID=2772509 RepID=A0A927BSN3_9BACL|nr:hypothetical protein [Paenibacillus sabuli]MBD2844819.1 hypothetical protein [Paenibacillus sabuli]